MKEIAQELGVEGLIEGSVLREGDDVRITVQLIDGRTDQHLWSESYTNTVTSVLKLQAEVALAIAGEIRAEVEPDEEQRIAEKGDVDPGALESYLRGRLLMQSRTQRDLERAVDEFQRAVDIDDTYAAAHSGLADAYNLLATYDFMSAEGIANAVEAAERAIDLDPSLAEAYTSLGWAILQSTGDWDRAEEAFEKAIGLDPNYSQGHLWYGHYLQWLGRDTEAHEAFGLAVELDPHSLKAREAFANSHRRFGDTAVAIKGLEELLSESPDFLPAFETLITAYQEVGEFEKAIAASERYAALRDNDTRATYFRAISLHLSGRPDAAQRLVDALPDTPTAERIEYFAVREDPDRVVEEFKALQASGRFYAAMRSSSWMNAIRDDDRYGEFLEELNYPRLPPGHKYYDQQRAYLARKAEREKAAEPIERIAVLPFTSIASDDSQEWFVDGMTDALITELGKIRAVKVTGRTSSMRFKNVAKLPQDIASELGVQGLIEGTVVRQDNRVRISARLIDGRNGDLLWGQDFLEEIEDILQLHGDLAIAIATEIQAAVTPEEEEVLTAERDIEEEAYAAYLLGTFYYDKGTSESWKAATEEFRRAVELKPDFAEAHARLADTLWFRAGFSEVRPLDVFDEIRTATERALELDPTNRTALRMSGSIAMGYEHDRETAENIYLRMIDTYPEDAQGYTGLAWCRVIQHRFDEAVELGERAVALDPLNAGTYQTLNNMYQAQYRYAESIEISKKALELEPEHISSLDDLVESYVGLGEFETALRHLDELDRVQSGYNDAYRADIYARMGRAEEARALLEAIEAEPDAERQALFVASAYSVLGEADKAFEWLEKLYEGRYWIVIEFTNSFALPFKNLHDDPRWTDLLERIGIAEYWDPESLP